MFYLEKNALKLFINNIFTIVHFFKRFAYQVYNK